MIKKISLLILICLGVFSQTELKSQDYTKSFGVRSGNYSGFTGKLMYSDQISMEGIIGWRNKGIVVTTLIEKYKPVPYYWGDGFQYYYGFGAHFGSAKTVLESNFGDKREWFDNAPQTAFVAGIDGIFGCEYSFEKYPFVVGFEAKPFLETMNVRFLNMDGFEFSFTMRYKLDN
jgi:hypothetical protein